jgi:WD40 repeat protein
MITKTPALTPTPYPTLSTSGPYLVYLVRTDDDHQALTLLDADGTGRKRLPLPDGAYISSIRDNLSPSGEWFAFHTGSASAEPYDITLHLMHLPDGEISTVAKLLSDEYPANFGPIAKRLLQDYPQDYPSEYYTEDSLAQLLQEIFIFGIHSLGWSPDGRYLAFAGQMDGISSDIYRLDTKYDTITQLTDGPDQIESISWSADGKWILHEASNDPYGEGWSPNIYAIGGDGSKGKRIFQNTHLWGWTSPTTYLVYDAQNGPGRY